MLRNKDQQQMMQLQVWPCKVADMSELQTHCCMTPRQWTWLLCSMSVIAGNKLSLQKLSEVIGIELLTSCFLENFGPKFQFPSGKYPFPPADALTVTIK